MIDKQARTHHVFAGVPLVLHEDVDPWEALSDTVFVLHLLAHVLGIDGRHRRLPLEYHRRPLVVLHELDARPTGEAVRDNSVIMVIVAVLVKRESCWRIVGSRVAMSPSYIQAMDTQSRVRTKGLAHQLGE